MWWILGALGALILTRKAAGKREIARPETTTSVGPAAEAVSMDALPLSDNLSAPYAPASYTPYSESAAGYARASQQEVWKPPLTIAQRKNVRRVILRPFTDPLGPKQIKAAK